MSLDFWCMDCMAVRVLDRHGRCECCGSGAVDIAVRPALTLLGMVSAFLTPAEIEMERERGEWVLIEEAGRRAMREVGDGEDV